MHTSVLHPKAEINAIRCNLITVRSYETLPSPNVPPMFYDFRCSSSEQSINQCQNPTGVTTSITRCGFGVVGIECEGMVPFISLMPYQLPTFVTLLAYLLK